MSFKRVLVTSDDSPATAKVFERAIKLARKDAGQLMIFHSVELNSPSQATMSLAALEIQTEQGTSFTPVLCK